MNTLKRFDTVLQEGLACLERTDDAAKLDIAAAKWLGVVYGYYLAGAVSNIEVLAAQAELRKTYNTIKSHALLCEQWRAANPEEASV